MEWGVLDSFLGPKKSSAHYLLSQTGDRSISSVIKKTNKMKCPGITLDNVTLSETCLKYLSSISHKSIVGNERIMYSASTKIFRRNY